MIPWPSIGKKIKEYNESNGFDEQQFLNKALQEFFKNN